MGAQKRDEIIHHAIKLIAGRGFDKVRFSILGKKVGLSTAAIYYHFPTKEKLIEAVLARIVERNHELISSKMQANFNAHERLCHHFEGNLQWALHYPAEAKIEMLLYYFSSLEVRYSKLQAQMRVNGINRVLEYLLAGEREGIYQLGSDAQFRAEALHHFLVGKILSVVTCSMAWKSQGLEVEKQFSSDWNRVIKYFTNS